MQQTLTFSDPAIYSRGLSISSSFRERKWQREPGSHSIYILSIVLLEINVCTHAVFPPALLHAQKWNNPRPPYRAGGVAASISFWSGMIPGTSHLSHISSILLWK